LLPHVQPSENANHCEEGHDEGAEDLSKIFDANLGKASEFYTADKAKSS